MGRASLSGYRRTPKTGIVQSMARVTAISGAWRELVGPIRVNGLRLETPSLLRMALDRFEQSRPGAEALLAAEVEKEIAAKKQDLAVVDREHGERIAMREWMAARSASELNGRLEQICQSGFLPRLLNHFKLMSIGAELERSQARCRNEIATLRANVSQMRQHLADRSPTSSTPTIPACPSSTLPATMRCWNEDPIPCGQPQPSGVNPAPVHGSARVRPRPVDP